jgi:hypothetical protein
MYISLAAASPVNPAIRILTVLFLPSRGHPEVSEIPEFRFNCLKDHNLEPDIRDYYLQISRFVKRMDEKNANLEGDPTLENVVSGSL